MTYTIQDLQRAVNTELLNAIPQNGPNSLYDPLAYIVNGGGKRLRSLLTLLSCGLLNKDPMEALHVSLAIELLHNFTLVHDDIMDKSTLRRGRETVHIKWDESTAILSGDVTLGIAYKLLLQDLDHHPKVHTIVKEFSEGLVGVCEGQALDIDFSKQSNISIQDYLRMIELKTARLLQAGLVCGAHVGLGTDKEIELLREFALNLGLAFQLQDDLLDLTAEQAEFGKSIGQDIVEGKKTYLMLLLLQRVQDNDRTLVDRFFVEHGLPQTELDGILTLLEKYGVFEETKNTVNRYTQKAKEIIEEFPENIYRGYLFDLANSLSIRTK